MNPEKRLILRKTEADYIIRSKKIRVTPIILIVLPLTLDSQSSGYRGVVYLLRKILKALRNPRSHREQMYESGLVI